LQLFLDNLAKLSNCAASAPRHSIRPEKISHRALGGDRFAAFADFLDSAMNFVTRQGVYRPCGDEQSPQRRTLR
jgi:hypothetical protein